jgi:hypothetical protein
VTCSRTRARTHAGRDSPLRALDEEIIRKVVDMVRAKTGVQRWRYIQVLSCALALITTAIVTTSVRVLPTTFVPLRGFTRVAGVPDLIDSCEPW